MTSLETLAEFVQDRRLCEPPAALLDRVKLHLLDTMGALLAGSRTPEGQAFRAFLTQNSSSCGVPVPGFGACTDLATSVQVACATVRCTEIDDIHLPSCTTPGSVIVPTALALAATGVLRTFREFAAAILAGYELLIRLGCACDGPAMHQNKLWPTYFAAAFGSAATASRAYGLSIPETAGALSTAMAFCTGTAVSPRSPTSSRWLTLGCAASNGALASWSARHGFLGDSDLLERTSGRISGVQCSPELLLAGLGQNYLFSEIGIKPYPVARQGLAAVEAVREVAARERLEPEAIEEIVVQVPGAQLSVINHPEAPRNRIGSIISAQYQVALALLAPERLLDVVRTPPFLDDRIRRLMAKVRVEKAPDLEKYYPDAWPGRVAITVNRRTVSHQLLHPHGDARNPFDWNASVKKFRTLAAPILGASAADRVACQVRDLDGAAEMPALWNLHV